MGLTKNSTGLSIINEKFDIDNSEEKKIVVALAGNPNTGKSTLFNNLTGLNQHTGNWPGKTVSNAKGSFKHKTKEYLLVDLPGTYSLLASSVEEEVARDFICFGEPEVTIVITDSTCLERNLNLALQVMEITDKVIVALNLMDEAERKGININIEKLQNRLGVPVIPIIARSGKGIDKLLDTLDKMIDKKIVTTPFRLNYEDKIENLVFEIQQKLEEVLGDKYNTRWLALRLIDGDTAIIETINKIISLNQIID